MDSLFKIKPIDERNIRDIENDRIWVPRVSDLNDPYDCAILPYLGSDIEIDELDHLVDELINESLLFRDIKNREYFEAKTKEERNCVAHKFICAQISNIGVCSFLDSPYNLVTWSHYGDNHKGMCIEYGLSDELERFTARVNGYIIENVSYINIAPWYEWRDFMKVPGLGLKLCLTTKYKDWAYENEIRLITYFNHGEYALDYKNLGLKIKKVYLGCKSSKNADRKLLETICKSKGIDIVQLTNRAYSYKLAEETVS